MVLVLSYLLKLDDASARYQYWLKAVSHMSTTYATLNSTTYAFFLREKDGFNKVGFVQNEYTAYYDELSFFF